MSKNILIVEQEAELMSAMNAALTARGCNVFETSDGKKCVDLIREQMPDLIILAVDLPAKQNGYLLCGKLKKDDDLKKIPIILIGKPDGFANHRKLPTHADDYLGKPFEGFEVVDVVDRLIGLPPPESTIETAGEAEEELSLSNLMEDDSVPLGSGEPLPDSGLNIQIEHEEPLSTESVVELEMIDAAFGSGNVEPAAASNEAEMSLDLDSFDAPPLPPPSRPAVPIKETVSSVKNRAMPLADAPVSPSVKARSIPLSDPPVPTSSKSRSIPLDENPPQTSSRGLRAISNSDSPPAPSSSLRASDSRIADLEAQLNDLRSQLEASKATAGRSDTKDVLALKDASNKKDKEILRLKGELNEKEQELIDLKDKELGFEQKNAEISEELASRDQKLAALQRDLEDTKKQMSQQATTFATELMSLRKKATDFEESARRNEDSARRHESAVGSLSQRLNRSNQSRERALQALREAVVTLEQGGPSGSTEDSESIELSVDELAEA